MINWLLKQVFYLKYLVLKQGNAFNPIAFIQFYILGSEINLFYSESFIDGQWSEFLPWYKDSKALQDWNTYGIFAQQYGRFYFKVRLDGLVTKNQWPALWLLEISDNFYFEIDIELLKNDLSFTIHWNHTGKQDKADPNYHIVSSKLRNRKLRRRLQKDYHLFLIDWSKEWIKFSINGILCARFPNEIHKPLQIIISKTSIQKVIVQK